MTKHVWKTHKAKDKVKKKTKDNAFDLATATSKVIQAKQKQQKLFTKR